MKLKVSIYEIYGHFELTNGCIDKYQGIIDCIDSKLHGQKFYHELCIEKIKDRRNFREFFYLEGQEKTFKTLRRLFNYYNK